MTEKHRKILIAALREYGVNAVSKHLGVHPFSLLHTAVGCARVANDLRVATLIDGGALASLAPRA